MNGWVRRLARRVAATLKEMNDAHRRFIVLRTAQDRYLVNPNQPPDTYAEFLERTSGVLLREPSARHRVGQHPV